LLIHSVLKKPDLKDYKDIGAYGFEGDLPLRGCLSILDSLWEGCTAYANVLDDKIVHKADNGLSKTDDGDDLFLDTWTLQHSPDII
jgi:hypothetical protein